LQNYAVDVAEGDVIEQMQFQVRERKFSHIFENADAAAAAAVAAATTTTTAAIAIMTVSET
jgi:hypothetical protein